MTNNITFISTKPKEDRWYRYKPKVAPYVLTVLASLVPDNWEPKIIDENFGKISFNEDTDLVAITVPTEAVPRAYEIADGFREKEIPALLGGIHPTVRSEEAMQHGTVVLREAETILPQVLRDFEQGNLKPIYDGGHCPPPLDTPKLPRFDLLKHNYTFHALQYSRGCPNDCYFCSASTTNGLIHRRKTHQRFIDEINSCGGRYIVVADDNFTGNRKEDREDVKGLLRKMKDQTDVIWVTQLTVDAANDDEFLKLATESGCKNVLVGFEHLDSTSLKEYGKFVNLKFDYKKTVRKLHDYDIPICGSFIFGSDNDTKQVFPDTVDFVKEADIDVNRFGILTPFPGTRLEERLRKEGRIFRNNYPEDWKYYNWFNVNYHPKNMTAEELETGYLEALQETSNPLKNCYRAFRTLLNTKSPYALVGSAWLNTSVALRVRDKLKEGIHTLPVKNSKN